MSEAIQKTRAQIWNEIEKEFFGRCFAQCWDQSGRILVERLEFPGSKMLVIVEKTYSSRVNSARGWPELQSVEVYMPVTTAGGWAELKAALQKLKS